MTGIQRLVRASRGAGFLALAALAFAATARASLIPGDSGNTQPNHTNPGAGVGGTVNFAVYDRTTGGTATDTFGTGLANFNTLFAAGSGSAAFDTTARYLYLYQVVNNGPNAGSFPISTSSVQVFPSLTTSFGTFTGTSFGTTVVGNPAGFADPGTISLGGAAPTVVLNGSSAQPNLVLEGSTSLRIIFTVGNELTSGRFSVLYGYTSNAAPVVDHAGLIDGGTTTDGLVLSAGTVPEPSAIVLSLIGLPLGLLLRRRIARQG